MMIQQPGVMMLVGRGGLGLSVGVSWGLLGVSWDLLGISWVSEIPRDPPTHLRITPGYPQGCTRGSPPRIGGYQSSSPSLDVEYSTGPHAWAIPYRDTVGVGGCDWGPLGCGPRGSQGDTLGITWGYPGESAQPWVRQGLDAEMIQGYVQRGRCEAIITSDLPGLISIDFD